ncbi:hypothetical protein ABZ372_29540 [Streptomyces sp. NPDC005921]
MPPSCTACQYLPAGPFSRRARPAQAVLVVGALTAVSLLFGAYVMTVARSPL